MSPWWTLEQMVEQADNLLRAIQDQERGAKMGNEVNFERPPEIKVNLYTDVEGPALKTPVEGFEEAVKRMCQSSMEGTAREAQIRAVYEVAAAMAVAERRRPWWAIWLLGKTWDEKESARCRFQRAAHMAAAEAFKAVVGLAKKWEK